MTSNTDVVKNYTTTCLYYVSISVSVCLFLCNDDNARGSFHGKSSRAVGHRICGPSRINAVNCNSIQKGCNIIDTQMTCNRLLWVRIYTPVSIQHTLNAEEYFPDGTALSSKPAAACGRRMIGQTDRQTDRRTDARQFHRPVFALRELCQSHAHTVV